MPPISAQIRQFSPLAREAFLKNLGLEDKNRDGVIERGAGEGYEQFTAKYGNADTGFFINGITQGANNGRLEENEIINHYYLNIRFKAPAETKTIENEVSAYIYANNIPLVWQDDRQGTVKRTVNAILGADWSTRKVTEADAVELFYRTLNNLNIYGLSGSAALRHSYYQMPDFIRYKTGVCFEAAQFGFWFFSQLGINSINTETYLTESFLHVVTKLSDSNKAIDYFGSSLKYNVPANRWKIFNPLQEISDYYLVQAKKGGNFARLQYFQQAAVYNKYDVNTVGFLMKSCIEYSAVPNYQEVISLGEFILQNINMEDVFSTESGWEITDTRNDIKTVLCLLIESYSAVKDRQKFSRIVGLLNRYFPKDSFAQKYIDYYKF
jgi:hypothetical protein